MKFRLVEDVLTENFRGQTELREFRCELLNHLCSTTIHPDHFMIHHKDGIHENNHPRNIVLLPISNKDFNLGSTSHNKDGSLSNNPNSSIHGQLEVDQNGFLTKQGFDVYIQIINNYQAIDFLRSLKRKKIVYLDSRLLKRDLDRSKKHPVGMIR